MVVAGGSNRLFALVLRLGLIATGSYLLPFVHGALSSGRAMWSPGALVMSFGISILAFWLLGAGVVARRPQRHVPWILAAFWISGAASFSAAVAAQRPGDAVPDNALLSIYAADLVLRGENPYRWDMSDAFSAFSVSGFFMTPRLDGSATSVLPYPALHFLLLVPVHAFGLEGARALYLLGHLLLGTVLFLRAPAPLRAVVLLPLWVSGEYLGFALSFVSDVVWCLLLLCSILCWRDWRWRAVFYGLACAYKQTPWLLAPFILIRLLIDERDPDRRPPIARTALFFATAGAVFLAFNGPFVVADPAAWLSRVLQPLTDELIYLGVGLASLTQLGVVELPKPFYSTASFAVMLALLLLYTAHFRRWRHVLWLLPGIMLWFSYRSLQSYFVYWIPLLVAAVVVDKSRRGSAPSLADAAVVGKTDDPWVRANQLPLRFARWAEAHRRWTSRLVGVTCLVLLLAAFHFARTSESVAVELLEARLGSASAELSEMAVSVTNTTDSVLLPRFAVQRASWQPYPWDIASGPVSLARGQSARYVIRTELPYRTLPLGEGGQLVITEATGNYRVRGTLKFAPDASFHEPEGIFNVAYHLMSGGGGVPWGWTLQRATAHEPLLERTRTTSGAPAFRVGFQANGANPEWEGVGIAQGVPFPDGAFRIWVNPPALPPDGGTELSTAYGLEFHDSVRRLWVLFGPGPPSEGYLEAGHYYFRRSLPAGTWSEQVVELGAVYDRLGWPLPPPRRTVRGNVELITPGTSVTLFVAARNRARGEAFVGEFGPLRIEPGARGPWHRIRDRIERPRDYDQALALLESRRRNFDRAEALRSEPQRPPE